MGSGSIVKSQDSSSVGQTVFTITVVWLRLFTAAGNTGSPDLTHTVCYSQSHFTPLPGEIWHRLPSADTALLNRNFEKKKKKKLRFTFSSALLWRESLFSAAGWEHHWWDDVRGASWKPACFRESLALRRTFLGINLYTIYNTMYISKVTPSSLLAFGSAEHIHVWQWCFQTVLFSSWAKAILSKPLLRSPALLSCSSHSWCKFSFTSDHTASVCLGESRRLRLWVWGSSSSLLHGWAAWDCWYWAARTAPGTIHQKRSFLHYGNWHE